MSCFSSLLVKHKITRGAAIVSAKTIICDHFLSLTDRTRLWFRGVNGRHCHNDNAQCTEKDLERHGYNSVFESRLSDRSYCYNERSLTRYKAEHLNSNICVFNYDCDCSH